MPTGEGSRKKTLEGPIFETGQSCLRKEVLERIVRRGNLGEGAKRGRGRSSKESPFKERRAEGRNASK